MKLRDETQGMTEKERQYFLDCISENEQTTDYGARLEKKNDIHDIKSYVYTEDKYTGNNRDLGGLFERGSSKKNPIVGWVIIIICIIMFFIWSEKGVRAVRELSIESVIVKGTVTSTDMKRELIRTGRHSRLETYYYITYQWVGDNDMLNVNTKKTKDPAHPLTGEEIDVTVRADNHNMELNSDEDNKEMLPIYSLMSIVWIVIGILTYVRYIKE